MTQSKNLKDMTGRLRDTKKQNSKKRKLRKLLIISVNSESDQVGLFPAIGLTEKIVKLHKFVPCF